MLGKHNGTITESSVATNSTATHQRFDIESHMNSWGVGVIDRKISYKISGEQLRAQKHTRSTMSMCSAVCRCSLSLH